MIELSTSQMKHWMKIDEMLSQNKKLILIGAGCSVCSGLPMMEKLTDSVCNRETLHKQTYQLIELIRSNFHEGHANIENYLSEMIDYLSIAVRRKSNCSSKSAVAINKKYFEEDDLRKAIEEIKTAIAINIDRKQIDLVYHRNFVKAIHRETRPGKDLSNKSSVDYLCLNYDTLIEDALGLEKIPYVDGMAGSRTAWWDSSTFYSSTNSRVIKLHGSIDWCEFEDDPLPRRLSNTILSNIDTDKRIMIWPASTKYRETQTDPYSQLFSITRNALCQINNTNKVLLIIGYSFNDAHINAEIDLALREKENDLTVIIFSSNNEPSGIVETWCKDPNITKQILLFCKNGYYHAADIERYEEDVSWWKFENIAQLLLGEIDDKPKEQS